MNGDLFGELEYFMEPKGRLTDKPHICVELRASMPSIIKASTIHLSLSFCFQFLLFSGFLVLFIGFSL